MVADTRLVIRRPAADGRHVLAIHDGHAAREIERRLSVLLRTIENLLVDVGDVADVRDLETIAAKDAYQDVERDGAPSVPRVRHVVHRRSAAVDTDLARCRRNEGLRAACEGVVEADLHRTETLPQCRMRGG